MDKLVTVGIPAYKAQNHICDALASIYMQTMRDNISVVIASDYPEDDYDFVKERYPNLEITVLKCEKNTGPGLARQRALDAAKTPWITFMDADDVLMSPFAVESLWKGINNNPNVIEVFGTFFQEIQGHPQGIRMMPRNDAGNPWVFAKLYNIPFLKQNKIGFSELRGMEDKI